MEAAALVHEGNAAVVRSYIVCRVTCIHARAGRKIEGRASSGAADASTRRRATVDVLLVAQFVIVVRCVVTLPGKERLQAVLAANVHGQKLLTILAREVIK